MTPPARPLRDRVGAAVERDTLAAERRALEATEFQKTVARDLGQLLEEEVDPLTVVQHGYLNRYYQGSVQRYGLEFRGHYQFSGDTRYHLCGGWQVVRRRRLRRTQTRNVHRLSQLEGWVR